MWHLFTGSNLNELLLNEEEAAAAAAAEEEEEEEEEHVKARKNRRCQLSDQPTNRLTNNSIYSRCAALSYFRV